MNQCSNYDSFLKSNFPEVLVSNITDLINFYMLPYLVAIKSPGHQTDTSNE